MILNDIFKKRGLMQVPNKCGITKAKVSMNILKRNGNNSQMNLYFKTDKGTKLTQCGF